LSSYNRITVSPVSGALGAEVSGVDLSNLDDETFDELYRAWLVHQVVFLRDQFISPEQQIAFAERFGDIHYHPFMKGLDDHPEILEIVREPNDSYTFGDVWHTDQMFTPKPAKATMLYALETPDAGGDTMFTNLYLGHDTLSNAMRDMLKDVKTWNSGNSPNRSDGRARLDRYGGNAKMSEKLKDPGNQITETAHPLIRTHPETGKKALYIGNHTQTLEGFSDAEAKTLIDFLMSHATRPEFTCRFKWAPGSMAIWDNRCTQHLALRDQITGQRRMHRITIAGDKPV